MIISIFKKTVVVLGRVCALWRVAWLIITVRNVIFVCASTQAHVHQGDAVGNVRKLGLKQRRMSEK